MIKALRVAVILCLLCGSPSAMPFGSPAPGEKIPALKSIPAGLPAEIKARLTEKKLRLESELKAFLAEAEPFNNKPAEQQTDDEYNRLEAWRARYIASAKAFNNEVNAAAPADTACGESSLGGTTLSAKQQERLTQRLSEARDRLRYINEALKKLIAINVAQREEIDKLTADITAQYDEAKSRACDVVIELLTSVSLDAFGAEQVKRMKGIDDVISGKIALKTTPLSAAQLQKVEEEIKLLNSAKFRLDEAYKTTEKLVQVYSSASIGKDIDDWRRENQEYWERAKSGLALIGSLTLQHPALERWLGKKAFFYGERLWHVVTMGKMAYYAWGFFLDIVTQMAIWEPMMKARQNELKANVRSMESLRETAAQTSKEISCLKELLR